MNKKFLKIFKLIYFKKIEAAILNKLIFLSKKKKIEIIKNKY